MGKIKIVHLLSGSVFSGAENVVADIIKMFEHEERFQMIYCSPDKYGYVKRNLEQKSIPYFPLTGFNKREVDRVIREFSPTVIHAHDYRASILASMQRKIPVVSHLHNNPPWQKTINKNSVLFALTIPVYKKVYGVSHSVYDEFVFKKRYGNKFEVLPNIVNREYIEEAALEGYVDRDIDILFVGRISPQKNPLEMLRIVKKVNETVPIHAALLGDGEMRKECEDFIRENHLENRVVIEGFVDNPYKYMKRSKLLLMPSIYEGFGLVAVESMVLGTPVVCSGVGGLSGIVDSQTGAICGNVQEYVDTIIDLLRDENKRKAMSEKSKEKALRFTGIDEYKKILKDEYEILGEK